ncbi:hypothetical protein IC006_2767 [Sulfuracidifex tepidarius]|uniref:Uncharacterized protein n=1 Tax=Sulfuracidifex tepidarius TaxID=1294262 RepID=A0A510DYY7_9CREN|nr:hypothetical protein IC006_2767 [Sulfuracidifex tepidarius]BBG28225.1 hypothetical protein IC007_2781 [Sulfuracidifex tepidarius]
MSFSPILMVREKIFFKGKIIRKSILQKEDLIS